MEMEENRHEKYILNNNNKREAEKNWWVFEISAQHSHLKNSIATKEAESSIINNSTI